MVEEAGSRETTKTLVDLRLYYFLSRMTLNLKNSFKNIANRCGNWSKNALKTVKFLEVLITPKI